MSPCFMATPPAINFMAVEHHPFSWGIFHCQRPDCWRVHPITSHWIPWIFQLNPITSHYINLTNLPLNPIASHWIPWIFHDIPIISALNHHFPLGFSIPRDPPWLGTFIHCTKAAESDAAVTRNRVTRATCRAESTSSMPGLGSDRPGHFRGWQWDIHY
jgi:hypothetical protein